MCHTRVLTKAQRESQISWSWRYRQLGTTQTECGTKLRSSGRATAALLAAEPPSSSLAELPKGCSPAKSPPLGTGERKWNVNYNNGLRHHRKRVEQERERQSRLQMPRAQTTALALRPRGLPSLLTVHTFFTSETDGLDTDFSSLLFCVLLFH